MHRKPMFAVAFLALTVVRVNAQRPWIEPDSARTIGLEVTKGFFKSNAGIDFASFLVTAQGRYPVSDKVALTAAIPFARVSGANTPAQTAFGNPWLGIEMVGQPGIVVEAGIRPGIAKEADGNTLALGFIEDFDRYEAWTADVTSIRAAVHIGPKSEQGQFISGYLGGTVSMASDGGGAGYLANYGIRAGWRTGGTLVSAALTGRANLSHLTVGGGLNERTMHQVGFIVERVSGRVRPIGSIRTFLDENARLTISAIVTAGISIVF